MLSWTLNQIKRRSGREPGTMSTPLQDMGKWEPRDIGWLVAGEVGASPVLTRSDKNNVGGQMRAVLCMTDRLWGLSFRHTDLTTD